MKEHPKVRQVLDAGHNGDLEAFKKSFKELNDSELGIDECVYQKSGDHLLHVLCAKGRLDLIEFLAQDIGHEPLKELLRRTKNLEAKTLLHEAAQNCQPAVVSYLLGQGVIVDALKRADWTPLMLACTKHGNLETIKLLCAAGPDLALVNKDGWNSFHLAAREGDVLILNYLVGRCPKISLTVSKNGRTPLHTAALAGKEEPVRYLLSLDHERNVKDSCGSTPVMDCARGGWVELIILFIDAGHSLDAHVRVLRAGHVRSN